MDKLLKHYYDVRDPGSFGGIGRLYRQLKQYGLTYDKVKELLGTQNAYTIHKDRRIRFPRNRVIAYSKDYQWMADLVFLPKLAKDNDGYRYIMVVIDVFSKYVWVRPTKTKQEQEMKRAWDSIFDEGRIPIHLQTDRGGEFDNEYMRDYFDGKGINYFTTQNSSFKCSVVERVNRTIKSRMFRYFTAKNTHRYVDIIHKLIDGYNNSYHRSIKMTPNQACEIEPSIVFNNLYGRLPRQRKPDLQEGDTVRMALDKSPFEKTYESTFSDNVMNVKETHQAQRLPLYSIKEKDGPLRKRRYYKQELQKVADPEIEEILDTRRRNRKQEYLVKYTNQPTTAWVTKI